MSLLNCGTTAPDEPGDDRDADFATAGAADGFATEGSAIACAALRAANEATLEDLDGPAGLNARTAKSIVDHRPYGTLVELDAAPYVGPVAFEQLVAFASSTGLSCSAQTGPLDDVIVRGRLSYHRREDELPPGVRVGWTFYADGPVRLWAHGYGTGTTARASVWGPIEYGVVPTELAVGGPDAEIAFEPPVPGVFMLVVTEADGEQGFVRVGAEIPPLPPCQTDADCAGDGVCIDRSQAEMPVESCAAPDHDAFDHDSCTEPGGRYVRVDFTAEEACRTLDFLNHASWTQLLRLPEHVRYSIFFGAFNQRLEWRSLASFTRKRFDGGGWSSGSIRALYDAARDYAAADHKVDTLDDIWAHRFEMRDRQVVLSNVFVKKRVQKQGYSCAEVRDSENGTRYMTVCHSCQGPDSCEFDTLLADQDENGDGLSDYGPLVRELELGRGIASRVGERANVVGFLTYRDGRWVVDADHTMVSTPR